MPNCDELLKSFSDIPYPVEFECPNNVKTNTDKLKTLTCTGDLKFLMIGLIIITSSGEV